MTVFRHEPNYGDVVYLKTNGHWPDWVVPAWAEERSEVWDVYPNSYTVLMDAMKHEINKLRDVVGICHAAMLRHDDGPIWREKLNDLCQYSFSSEIEIALRALGLEPTMNQPTKEDTSEKRSVLRICVRCKAELHVTSATDEEGRDVEVSDHVVCGRCLTPEERSMYAKFKQPSPKPI